MRLTAAHGYITHSAVVLHKRTHLLVSVSFCDRVTRGENWFGRRESGHFNNRTAKTPH